MMKTRINSLLFCCLLPCLMEAQHLFSLQQCREMALENNKQAAIAGKTFEKANYEVNTYRAHFFPKFSANGTYLYTTQKMRETIPGGYLPTFVPDASGNLVPNIVPGTESAPVFKAYSYMPDMPLEFSLSNTFLGGVQLEQPLYAGGKIRAAYRMSTLGKEMADLNRNLTRAQILVQTDEAYWNCVKARELHLSAQQYKKVITELLRNVENAQAVGLKQKNDVLKVQVKWNEAELQIKRAENAIRLSRMNLCHIIGLPLDTDVAVSASFPETTDMPLEPIDITHRPEYDILSHQTALKKQETKLTRSDFLPQLGLQANYNYMNGLKLNGEKRVADGAFSALLSLRIPLFEWGKGVNKVRAARAEEHISQLQQHDAAEKMTLEAAQAFNALEEAQLEIRLTARSLEQAEENRILSRNMYEAGMETLADHLEAQTIWQKASADFIQAKALFQYNKTYYLKAIGKL